MRTILGIDPGLATTGYGIIQAGKKSPKHISHGAITTPSGMSKGERLVKLYTALDDIIDEFQPEEAGLETLYFAKNVKTAFPVAEARGVILLCLANRQIVIQEYTPLQVKQAVIGKGRAEKKQIQRVIALIYSLQEPPKPDDAADALAVALCHFNYSHRREVIESSRTNV